MRSLLDSYIEIDSDNAVFSILKMGKRFVGLIEEFAENGRSITIFSFIKNPLEMMVSEGQSIEHIDDIHKKCTGYLIFEQKTVVEESMEAIENFLNNIDTLGYFSKVNWSSSYSLSCEQLIRLTSILQEYQNHSFPYNSVNNQKRENGNNNQKWFIQLLKSADLKISPPTDEGDPVMFDSLSFPFSSHQDSSNTSLLKAAYDNNLEQAKFEIANGADVNALVNVGLIRSAFSTLFYSGVDGIYKYDKFSALMFAVCRNNEAMVKYLIDNKADIDLTVKIKGRPYSAMDFAILFHLSPIFIAFYNLDAKHHLPLSYGFTNNHSIIESLGLVEFASLPTSCVHFSSETINLTSIDRPISAENVIFRPNLGLNDSRSDAKSENPVLEETKDSPRICSEQKRIDLGCELDVPKNEIDADVTYSDAKLVVPSSSDSINNKDDEINNVYVAFCP